MYIPPPATYANTIHTTKRIDIKHFSNGQLSRKVVQLIYVGCPRLMQIYMCFINGIIDNYEFMAKAKISFQSLISH